MATRWGNLRLPKDIVKKRNDPVRIVAIFFTNLMLMYMSGTASFTSRNAENGMSPEPTGDGYFINLPSVILTAGKRDLGRDPGPPSETAWGKNALIST